MNASLPSLLELRDVSKRFGGLEAVSGFSMGLERGQIVGLVGPNGAGKSTVLNLVAGSQTVSAGEVFFGGARLTSYPEYLRARLGIVRVFQDVVNLDRFSVADNIQLGLAAPIAREPPWARFSSLWRAPRARGSLARINDDVLDLLELSERARSQVGELSHWERRLSSFGRALACEPTLMLLDEPFGGLDVREIERLIAVIVRLRKERGQSFLVVEHNMQAVRDLCDRVVVMHLGKNVADDCPDAILSDPRVIDVYLGGV